MKTSTRSRAGPSRLVAFLTLLFLSLSVLITPALAQGGDHGLCGGSDNWLKADWSGSDWTWEEGSGFVGGVDDYPELTVEDVDTSEDPWEVSWTSDIEVSSVHTKASTQTNSFAGGYEGTVFGATSPHPVHEDRVIQHAISFIVFCYATSAPEHGDLAVSKVVTGDAQAIPADASFPMTITCELGEDEFGWSDTVADGETWGPFLNLPAGAECTVTETDALGATRTTVNGEPGSSTTITIEAGGVHEVVFTNHFPADDDNGNGPPPPPPPPVLDSDIELVKEADITPDSEGDKVVTFDADGDPVTITYDYLITNTGETTLTHITLVDDPLGPITVLTDTLAPEETTTGTIDYVVTAEDAEAGEIFNEADVTGQAPDGTTVEASDDELVYVETVEPVIVSPQPGISLEKASDVQADDDGIKALVYDPDVEMRITYTYTITNTGDTTLTDIILLDDILGPISVPDVTLEPGGQVVVEAVHLVTEQDAAAGQILNLAVVTGTAPGDVEVTDSDSELVYLVAALPLVPEPPAPDTTEPTTPPAETEPTTETEVEGEVIEKKEAEVEVLGEVLEKDLPRTGADSGALALLAAAMLLAGGVLLRANRPVRIRARR